MILGFFDPLRNPLSFFDPLRDPLKDNAVVPQKYVEMMERQGYVRVTRCKNCKRWKYDLDLATIGKGTCLNSLLWTKPDDYCSHGERADSPTCGPDYCEIGGEDDE